MTRHTLRARVALLVILSLLGVVGLDASVCRGPDGHFSIDTHFSTCCRYVPSAISSDPSMERNSTISPGSSSGDETCSDTPLIHGTLAAHRDDPAAGCAGYAITVIRPEPVALAHRATAPSSRPGSVLSRLRTTTLLI